MKKFLLLIVALLTSISGAMAQLNLSGKTFTLQCPRGYLYGTGTQIKASATSSDASEFAIVTYSGSDYLYDATNKAFVCNSELNYTKQTGNYAKESNCDFSKISKGWGFYDAQNTDYPYVLMETTYNNWLNVDGGGNVYINAWKSFDDGNKFKYAIVNADFDDTEALRMLEETGPITAFSQIGLDRLYTISAADSRGNWMYGSEDPLFVSSTKKLDYAPASDDTKQQWAFWKIDDKYYLYNVGAERFATAQYGYSWTGAYLTLTPFPITPVDALEASTNTTWNTDYPTLVRFGGTSLQTFGVSNGQTHAVFRYNVADDAGNATRILGVANFTAEQKARATEVATASLPVASSGTTIKYYNIWNMRSDKIVSYSPDGTQLDQTDAFNEYSAFYFRAVDDGYYIYSATNGLPLKDVSSESVTFGTDKDDATKYYISSNTQNVTLPWATLSATGYNISTSSTASDAQAWNDGGQSSVTKYNGNDGGSIWRFSTALNGANNLAAKREEVKNYIDNYTAYGSTEAAKNALEAVYNETFSSVAELDAALTTFLSTTAERVYRIKSMNSGYSANAYIYNDSYDVMHPVSYQNNSYTTPYWSTSTADEVKDFSYFYLTTTDGLRYNASVVEPGTYKLVQAYNDKPLISDAVVTVSLITGQTDQFNIKIGSNSIHAQQTGSSLVFWNSSDNTANNASAWTFEAVDEGDIDLDLINARAKVRSIYKFLNNHTFGTSLGQYHSGSRAASDVETGKTTLSEALNNAATTATEYESLNTTYNPYVTETAINTPSEGQFIYLKSVNNSRYVQAVDYAANTQLAMSSGNPTINNIFSYVDGKLVSYSKGLYIQNTKFVAAVGSTDQLGISFEEATVIGKYEIKGPGSDYMYGYASGEDKVGLLDRISSGSKNTDPCRWTLEEVTTIPVTISSVGYATLYAPVALTIPTGVTAYTATDNGTSLSLTEISTTIPANTGVILKGNGGTYDFAITTTDNTANSALTGIVATIAKPVGSYYLGNGASGVGFYPADDSSITTMAGFKAYLPAANGVKSFIGLQFGDEDAIKSLFNENGDVEIYNLAGQRINKLQKGVNIINGKKVLVK